MISKDREKKIHAAWRDMKNRCNNPNQKNYKYYGGRGIGYAKEWETFIGFKKDMGRSYRQGLTLDRLDNNRGYSKENCKWSSWKVQANNKRNNHLMTYRGTTLTIAQWAEKIGVPAATLQGRVTDYGWSVEEALTLPKWGRRSEQQG